MIRSILTLAICFLAGAQTTFAASKPNLNDPGLIEGKAGQAKHMADKNGANCPFAKQETGRTKPVQLAASGHSESLSDGKRTAR